LAAFNRALAFGIARDSSLEYQPRDHATRFGHHTGDLSGSRTPAIRALNESIITAAKQRIEEVPRTSDHPFHKSWPRTYKLYSWAVIMDEEGHQTPHIHSNGWLSGVYYVEIPGEMRGDDAERHGWLEFGQSEQRWHRSNVMPHHYVFPEAGMLVTFPSFYWHNTRPLKSKSRRISFAFDIIPA
jgi:uncharacterized protein (TIGR02466 family)